MNANNRFAIQKLFLDEAKLMRTDEAESVGMEITIFKTLTSTSVSGG